MAEVTLHYDVFVDAIGEEVERFLQATQGHFSAPVPSCPDWHVADLVEHLTNVYRSWAAQLRAEDVTQRTQVERSKTTNEIDQLTAFEGAVEELTAVFAERDATAPCWNYTGDDLTAMWVARRLAHESAIHRVDAELANGDALGIERELAADGLIERIAVVLPVRVPGTGKGSLGGSLCLVCDDIELSFVVEAESGRWRFRRQRGPADCVIVGSASDLFRFSWGRPPRSALQLTGDDAVAAAWSTLPG